MSNIIYQIRERMDKLTKKQKRIATELLDNPQAAIYYSTEELAILCDASHAAISRFCYLFDYYGLKDLQISLARELSLIDEYTIISPESDDFSAKISENVLGQTTIALKNTYKRLKEDQIKLAAEAILSARRIYLVGIGASDLVAQDLFQKLLRIQKDAMVYTDNDLRKVALLQAQKEDVLIAISYSGEKQEILELVSQVKSQGVPIIAIVKAGHTALSVAADINLEVAGLEKDFRSSALTSRIVQLYVVDVLYHTCCALLGSDKVNALQNTYNIVRKGW
ncbi:transcriptional regulator MurR [Erysipelotrichaceae bacterium]|nr:transcriptional regulator MurR [Erysipelotrichaceae bacterium]